MLFPASRLGDGARLEVVDASAYAACSEAVNFWQLLARAQADGDLLLGYYRVPSSLDEPLDLVVSPLLVGMAAQLWHCVYAVH